MPDKNVTAMKKLSVFLWLMNMVFLSACTEKGDDASGEIQLLPGTSNSFSIHADQTEPTPDGISFTASGPWRATVAETRASNSGNGEEASPWLIVSPDHGDAAGNYTIHITLGINATGKDRKAVITIECGSSKITISVEQKATTEEGTVPDEGSDPVVPPAGKKRISHLELTQYDSKGTSYGNSSVDFAYDSQDRLTEITVTGSYPDEDDDVPLPNPNFRRAFASTRAAISFYNTVTFTYGERNVTYETTLAEDGASSLYKETGSVELDEEGRAVSGTYRYYEDENELIDETYRTYELTYDAAGYLARTVVQDEGAPNEESRITWSGGNPTAVKWGTNSSGEEAIDRASYGNIPNRSNLDLNWSFLLANTEGWGLSTGDSNQFFSLLGLTGKRPAQMVTAITPTDVFGSNSSYSYTYETDADGLPVKIVEQTHPEGSRPYKSSEYVITYTE